MRHLVTAACVFLGSISSLQARADSCKPDVSRVDKITKQKQDIWTQKVGGTGFGASLMGSTDMAVFITVGRYGTFNAVNVEILKEEASAASSSFDSSLHAVKGNQFFLGFKEGGDPLTFVATDVGNSTKVRNDVLDFGNGKVVTSVVLSSAVSDEALAGMREALTTKRIDAIRVLLVGDLRVEYSMDEKTSKKLMAKFQCFFEAMDKRGVGRPAGQAAAAQNAPANDPARMAAVQGRYARKGKPSDFIELNADGTSGLQQDGHSMRGNYAVQGDTIIFTSPQIRGQTKARFIGDTIRDDDGIVWERASEPQEGGDASDEKPLSADDILRATSAGSVGDASGEPGTKSGGSPGQALQPGASDTHLSKPFTNKDVTAPARAGLGDKIVIAKPRSMPGGNRDTSTDALIHLKKAGVSKAAQGGSVQSVEGQYVRWNRGSLYGLRAGLQARIVRNGEPIATGRVIDVRPDDSDIELDTVGGLNDVVVGDTVEVK